MDELERRSFLLRMTGNMLSAVLEGLEDVDPETKRRVMARCGEACAREKHYGPAVDIAWRISGEEGDLDRILERANEEISWCGEWVRDGDAIRCTCDDCGCPLVRGSVLRLGEALCYCSLGWVSTIFEALLRRPVRVELEKALGLGDDECRYAVFL